MKPETGMDKLRTYKLIKLTFEIEQIQVRTVHYNTTQSTQYNLLHFQRSRRIINLHDVGFHNSCA